MPRFTTAMTAWFLLTLAAHAADPIIIDSAKNGNPPEFTIDSGTWTETTSVYYNPAVGTGTPFNKSQLVYYAPPNSPGGAVTWTFTGLDSTLTYDVAATWAIQVNTGNRSTNAQYSVTGDTTIGPSIVSQVALPTADYTAEDSYGASFPFQTLFSLKPDANGTIALNLSAPVPDLQMEAADAVMVVALDSQNTPGDFNGDGVVNLADYTVWHDNLGAVEDDTILSGNGDGGTVDATDYDLWKTHFGEPLPPGAIVSQSVPEPTTTVLLVAGSLALATCRRRS